MLFIIEIFFFEKDSLKDSTTFEAEAAYHSSANGFGTVKMGTRCWRDNFIVTVNRQASSAATLSFLLTDES